MEVALVGVGGPELGGGPTSGGDEVVRVPLPPAVAEFVRLCLDGGAAQSPGKHRRMLVGVFGVGILAFFGLIAELLHGVHQSLEVVSWSVVGLGMVSAVAICATQRKYWLALHDKSDSDGDFLARLLDAEVTPEC
eukprot:COSAG02_NODE_30146_length_556_cov_1.129103_1_plen_134_part_01